MTIHTTDNGMEDPGGQARSNFDFRLPLLKMCSQESHCRRIMAPFGTVVGQADSKVEDMVGGKGVLMAMMVDDNAEKVKKKLGGKILQDSV